MSSTTGAKGPASAAGSVERRRAKRRAILSTFSLFVVLPKKGVHRLEIRDLSDLGIGFDLDIEGESPSDFPVAVGDRLELQLFLNQTLFLPLSIEVKRIVAHGSIRQVGAEFVQQNQSGYRALQLFLEMLDGIIDAARITAQNG